MTLWKNVLVIGGTTDGLGKDFIASLREDEHPQRLWAPDPDSLDVTDPYSIDKFLDNHFAMGFGPVECLYYAAGAKHLQFLAEQDMKDVQHTFDVNVFGFLNVMKALLERQKFGRVCVVTSEAAVTPMRTTLAYCASKAALEMALKCVARETAPDWLITGIRPTVISNTPITDRDIIDIAELRGWTQVGVEKEFSNNPLGRMVDKREVSKLACWLLFEAPHAMTGSIVEVRCGK